MIAIERFHESFLDYIWSLWPNAKQKYDISG